MPWLSLMNHTKLEKKEVCILNGIKDAYYIKLFSESTLVSFPWGLQVKLFMKKLLQIEAGTPPGYWVGRCAG